MEFRNEQQRVSLRNSCAEVALTGCNVGKSTIYLHQSGASVLSDGSGGDVLNEHIYSDARPEELDALPNDAPHRSIDIGKSILKFCSTNFSE